MSGVGSMIISLRVVGLKSMSKHNYTYHLTGSLVARVMDFGRSPRGGGGALSSYDPSRNLLEFCVDPRFLIALGAY